MLYGYLCISTSKDGTIKEEIHYYNIPYDTIDLTTDWRFKEVPGIRKKLVPTYTYMDI